MREARITSGLQWLTHEKIRVNLRLLLCRTRAVYSQSHHSKSTIPAFIAQNTNIHRTTSSSSRERGESISRTKAVGENPSGAKVAPMSSTDGGSPSIPAPLPLLRRGTGLHSAVVYKNAFGAAVEDVEHRESGAIVRHFSVEAAHYRHCITTGERRCPSCMHDSALKGQAGDGKPGHSVKGAAPAGVLSPLPPQLSAPVAGTVCGSEPVADQDLAYDLHKFLEMCENSPCESCEEVDGSDVDSDIAAAVKRQAAGCRLWPGAQRFTVFASDYGKSEVNVATVASVALYQAACKAAKSPSTCWLPSATMPLPLPRDSSQLSSLLHATFPSSTPSTFSVHSASSLRPPLAYAPPTATSAEVFDPHTVAALQDSLKFSSCFESGNLKRADRIFTRFCPHKCAVAGRSLLLADAGKGLTIWMDFCAVFVCVVIGKMK